MPNTIAYLALLSWPLCCLILFRRTSIERAIIWSILGGYLLLPPVANFNFPLIPPLDKTSIPNISAFLICLVVAHQKIELWPTSRVSRLLMIGFVFGAISTVLTNTEPTVFEVLPNSAPIIYKTWELPGLKLRDVISALGNQVIVILPFLLARQFLGSAKGMRDILLALVLAGMAYSLPALLEIRLSPQVNTWVYGFFQHEFLQTIRAGGFRPLVFLQHPLWLAFFVVSTVLAAAALAKGTEKTIQIRFLLAMLYLGGLLYLCKSMASLAYGLGLAPLVLFAGARLQVMVAVAFALIATIYPLLRGMDLIPVGAILDWATSVNPIRAESLAYRFENETQLLARASEKPWLGWGGWGRNLILDSDTGEILTIPDGRWIIVFGTYGWLGYVCEFGLLAMPVLMLGRAGFRKSASPLSRYAAAMALILGINMVDMLLNAALTPLTWLIAGAAMGHAESLNAHRRAEKPVVACELDPLIGSPHASADSRPLI